MNSRAALASCSEFQRRRAKRIDQICRAIVAAMEAGTGKLEALRDAARQHDGEIIEDEAGNHLGVLRFSAGKPGSKTVGGTARRILEKWLKSGRDPYAVCQKYSVGGGKIPAELITELKRRRTLKGVRTNAAAIKSIKDDYRAGNDLPGIGTWQDFWAKTHPDLPLPELPPEFPFSDAALNRCLPRRTSAFVKMGTIGVAAARQELKTMLRDSSQLPAARLYTADDARLDIVCLAADTRRLSLLKVYLMQEWGSRLIVAYALRAGNALTENDVRAMVVRGLKAGGLCATGTTHVVLESGMMALSQKSVEDIEYWTEGRVAIHRTEMIAGRTWAGAAPDKPVGNPRGKGVIEVFIKKLHALNMLVPGQTSNHYSTQPANLGLVGQWKRPTPGSVLGEAEMLAQYMAADGSIRLELPVKWSFEIAQILADSIKEYNSTRGHKMQGFGHVTQIETAPDVWEDAELVLQRESGGKSNGDGDHA
jgi:hypothetical protein